MTYPQRARMFRSLLPLSRGTMRGLLTLCGVLIWSSAVWAEEQPAPTFRQDVMAVLSHSGCNMGTCHGNAKGKGGLKLSLRGDDPDADYAALTRDLSGRRVNVADPDASLMLLKPTMQLAHQGGQRFALDSLEYSILRQWIARGTPDDPPDRVTVTSLSVEPREVLLSEEQQEIPLTAVVQLSDGTQRDITQLASFDIAQSIAHVTSDGVVHCEQFGETTITVRYLHLRVPVRIARVPDRPGFVFAAPAVREPIDRFIFAKLELLKTQPAPICDDTTFVRRASLDLTGRLPTAEEARRFVASTDPGKRATFVDALLLRPEFSEFWALKWSDVLRNEEKTLDRKGVENFTHWLRTQIANDAPWNEMAAAIVSARGSTYSHAPTNYYRALRDPITRAEATAQVFLGVRLQCAKCHNHPFDRWTQNDFYSWSNLFARVDYKIVDNDRRDDNDKHEFIGEQIVFSAAQGEVDDPRTKQPRDPQFLLADKPVSSKADRLDALGGWIADPANPFFAKAQVNRVWFHLFGRGIVDPLDDFRESNPPSHPELLDALARDFAAQGFHLKPLIRSIMNSATYQLASDTQETNLSDEVNFSHAYPRRLGAEQLLDAFGQSLGTTSKFAGFPEGTRALEIPGVRAVRPRDEAASASDKFLTLFGKSQRLQSCDCERTDSSTLVQAFQLISGESMQRLLTAPENRIATFVDQNTGPSEIIHEAYWSTLSRPPSPQEESAALALLSEPNAAPVARRAGLEDLFWSLLTSHEFVLRR